MCLVSFLVVLIYVQGLIQPFKSFAVNASDLLLLSLIVVMGSGALFLNTYNFEEFLFIRTVTSYQINVHSLEIVNYSTLLSIAYLVFTAITIWHILKRIPKLKIILKKLFCKNSILRVFRSRTQSKNQEDSSNSSFGATIMKVLPSKIKQSNNKEEGSSYGAATVNETRLNESPDGDLVSSDEEEGLKHKPNFVTFFQLREPLLETSGSLSLQIVSAVKPSNPN